MDSFPLTRADAKSIGATKYIALKACPRGHKSLRWTASGACAECTKVNANRYRAEDPEGRRAYEREYYQSNLDAVRAKNRAKAKKLREYYRAYGLANRRANPDQFAEYRRRYQPKRTAQQNLRHARKLQATPPWLTPEMIKQIEVLYAEAARLTIETGEIHHVDHVLPLQGDTVSGLHIPENLRVIPASVNLRKSNKVIDEQLVRPN